MSTDIVVALVGFFGVLIGAIPAYLAYKQARTLRQERNTLGQGKLGLDVFNDYTARMDKDIADLRKQIRYANRIQRLCMDYIMNLRAFIMSHNLHPPQIPRELQDLPMSWGGDDSTTTTTPPENRNTP